MVPSAGESVLGIKKPKTSKKVVIKSKTLIIPSGLQTLTNRSYANANSSGSKYYYPYHVDQQELSFYLYCGDTSYSRCQNRDFYYLARVINNGTFIAEPATVQSYEYPEIINVSGDRGIVEIE